MSFKYSYKPRYYPTSIDTGNEFKEYLVKLQEMKKWCDEQKFIHYNYAHGMFMFDREEDYTFFLLRWE
jgi:hypothetical protein